MQIIVPKKNRIEILDALRGIAIIFVVFYHLLYDMHDIYNIAIPFFGTMPFEIVHQLVVWFFILLAGVSSRFSHNNVKRGVQVLAFGMAITAITVIFFPSQAIYFGILHFIGCAVLLFVLVRPAVDRVPPHIALPALCMIFALTINLPDTHSLGFPGLLSIPLPDFLVNTPNLYPLGFPDGNFFSADYFPLIPWFFLFLIGTVIGVPIRERRFPKGFYSARVPFFSVAGRNTLLIYALHQPVFMGFFSLLQFLWPHA